MRRKGLLLVVVWMLLMPGLPLVAQQEFREVTRWRVIEPKPGMEQQFEEAYRRHVREWGGRGRLWPWLTWQIETGEQTGRYVVGNSVEQWEAFDARAEDEAAARDDFHTNVSPYVKSLSGSITVRRSDIDRGPWWSESLRGADFAEVTHFHLHFGSEEEFTYVQREIAGAIEKISRDDDSISGHWYFYQWHQLASGSHQPTFVLIRPFHRWADLEVPEKSIELLLEEAYGREEAALLVSRFDRSVKSVHSVIWRFRYDLSSHLVAKKRKARPRRRKPRRKRAAPRRKPPARPAPRPQVMPQFPWPPPKWTSRYVLPHGPVTTGKAETLGLSFDRITEALIRGGIYQWSTYAIGDDGFAVVSRVEQIGDDGRPKSGNERWTAEPVSYERGMSFREWLKAVFQARPGRYRVIVLVVTTRAVTAGEKEPQPSTMEELLKKGAGDLPDEMRKKDLGPSEQCEALIYEFHRPSEDDDPVLVGLSQISVIDHLSAAGLWRKEELLP